MILRATVLLQLTYEKCVARFAQPAFSGAVEMDRFAIFSTFAEKWIISWETIPDAEQIFKQIEQKAHLSLPEAYRQFVLHYGTPSTAWLLPSIVEGGHIIEDLQEFLSLDKLIPATRMYESGGMDTGFLAFAMDGSGNLFLFKETECLDAMDDAPVWFFDHDFITLERIAESFAVWISRYNEIKVKKDLSE